VIACLICALLALPALAQASTFTVTKTADTNDGTCDADCSLREAVGAANANPGPDTITLPAGTYRLTLTGAGEDANATGDLDVTGSPVTINGAGARSTIIDGNATDRVIQVLSGAGLVANDLTLTDGKTGGTENGGAIESQGSLSLYRVQVSGNSTASAATCPNTVAETDSGAGIDARGTLLNLDHVAVVRNQAACFGGGVEAASGTVTITDTTIAGNSVTTTTSPNTGAAGIDVYDLTVSPTFTNDTIALNTSPNHTTPAGLWRNTTHPGTYANTIVAANAPNDCAWSASPQTAITVTAPNLDSDSACFTGSGAIHSATPRLAAPADNGGPTDTVALLSGSPAIDTGSNCLTTDQRGLPRPMGPQCDIGAFELWPGSVSTGAPTEVARGGATLNGLANPENAGTSVHFDYGTTTAYGSQTSAQSIGSGASEIPFSASVSGLTPGTTYHYRAVATNGVDTVYGGDQVFTTGALPDNSFQVGAPKGMKLKVLVQSTGTLTLADGGGHKPMLKNWSVVGGPGTVVTKLHLAGPALRLLHSKGKLTVQAKITFTPDGGTPDTQTVPLKIKLTSHH
jgi:CSLREA domain-containing protein